MSEPRLFLFSGQDILVPDDSSPAHPADLAAELGILEAPRGRRDFEWAGRRYSAISLDEKGAAAALGRGLKTMPLHTAIHSFDAATMQPALKGIALLNWLEVARFCGACGARLLDEEPGSPDGSGRRCGSCGKVHFPRISPAVIVLVRRGQQALLAHNSRFPLGRFGLIAGFVEAGETLEEAAIREIREEAGIEVKNLQYRKSQPWPFPDSLMLAFTAEWASGEGRPDGVEITELRWCSADELPNIPPPGSVARFLIDEFSAEARG